MSENNDDRVLGFNTRALHHGYQPETAMGARAVPIFQTTSFVFKDSAHAANLFALQEFGNIYTRIMNPTTDVLEQRVASLENGAAGLAMSSGQSAQFVAINSLMEAGDEMVAATTLYGGTYTQFDVSFRKIGYHVRDRMVRHLRRRSQRPQHVVRTPPHRTASKTVSQPTTTLTLMNPAHSLLPTAYCLLPTTSYQTSHGFTHVCRVEFPWASRTLIYETGMVGVAGTEVVRSLVSRIRGRV